MSNTSDHLYNSMIRQIDKLRDSWANGARSEETADLLCEVHEMAAELIASSRGEAWVRELPSGAHQDHLTAAAKWARAVV